MPFPPPEGAVPVRLCALTGKPASSLCERVLSEWLPVAGQTCNAHVRAAVDAGDGSPATTRSPAELVEDRTFTLLPPRYAAWAAAPAVRIVVE